MKKANTLFAGITAAAVLCAGIVLAVDQIEVIDPAVGSRTATDTTGTGKVVRENTPSLITPGIGAATGTSFALSGRGALGGATLSSSTNLIFPAGTTGISQLRLTHGVAPSSPVNGDVWTTTTGMFVRVNGATVGPLAASGAFDQAGNYTLTGTWDFTGGTVSFGTVGMTTLTTTALELEGATADAFEGAFACVDPTADRTWTFPNANTFVPVIPQIITVTGPTAARTWTVPDANFTVARTDAANTFTGVQTMTAPVFVTKAQLPTAAGSSTLSTGGDAAYNTSNKVLGIHNGTKEVGVSTIYHQAWSFDPKAVCDGTTDRLFLMSTDISEPFGIHIVKWKVSFDADPTTEFGANHVMLKRADAFIGVANAANMDALDTTAGAAIEATSSNINSDAVVATSKVIYLQFDTAYTESGHQVIFEMWWEVEED